MFKKLIAEFFATFILVLVGCGVAIGVGCGDTGGIVATAAAFGLSIVILAYSFGQISGGHANPAVSLAMAIRGDITWKEFGFYCLAQVLGAFTASGLLAFIFWGVKSTGSNSLQGIMNILGNTEVNFSDVTFGLVAEIVLTFIFIFVILGVTSKKEWGGVAGIVIGAGLDGRNKNIISLSPCAVLHLGIKSVRCKVNAVNSCVLMSIPAELSVVVS